MTDYNLDLDALAPKVEHVKLNGEVIEVQPPKFKAIVDLLKIQSEWNSVINDPAKAMDTVQMLRAKISELVPRLKDDGFDITVEQMSALMTFLFTIANPQTLNQAKEASEAKVETPEASETEKKTA